MTKSRQNTAARKGSKVSVPRTTPNKLTTNRESNKKGFLRKVVEKVGSFVCQVSNSFGLCGCQYQETQCAKCTQEIQERKRQEFLEAQAKIEAKAKADYAAEVQRLADIEYNERQKFLAKWQRESEEREAQRKEVDRLKAIEVENKRKECNPFYLVRSTTQGEFDNWVNCFSMNLEGGKRLYFVFSGDKIKELDLRYNDDLNFGIVGVAGHIKTTGEKLEIISKTDHFYFLKGNQSPFKKYNHLIVATYENFTEFYMDNFYFGKSTWIASDPPRDTTYDNVLWGGG